MGFSPHPQRVPLSGPFHLSHIGLEPPSYPKRLGIPSFQGILPYLKVSGDLLWLRLGKRAKQQRLIYLPSIPPYVVYAQVCVCVCVCVCVSKLLELTKSLSIA